MIVAERVSDNSDDRIIEVAVDFLNTIIDYDYDTMVSVFATMFNSLFREDAEFVANDVAKIIPLIDEV